MEGTNKRVAYGHKRGLGVFLIFCFEMMHFGAKVTLYIIIGFRGEG